MYPSAASLTLPPFIQINHSPGIDAPTVNVTTSYDADRGRYVASSVDITHPLMPIQGTTLRGTPIRKIIAMGVRKPLLEANPQIANEPAVRVWAKGPDQRARDAGIKMRQSPQDKHLAQAAAVLALATVAGEPCIKAVERAMGLTYEEAVIWVKRIRRNTQK